MQVDFLRVPRERRGVGSEGREVEPEALGGWLDHPGRDNDPTSEVNPVF